MTEDVDHAIPIVELNPKREMFCRLFASEEEFFGNGVRAYIQAYGIDPSKPGAYNGARTNAHKLLTNTNILARINQLLEGAVLNDAFVDKQIAMLIAQNADFGSKIAAIKEYNALKQRITKKLVIDDQRETKEKIKGFLDGQTGYDESDAAGAEPAAGAAESSDTDLASTP